MTRFLRFVLSAMVFVALGIYLSHEYNKRSAVPVYNYKIVNQYTHGRDAFTEGLFLDNGYLYESTGLYSKSALRKIDLYTGTIVQEYTLPANYFAEGVAIMGDQLYQLTYREQTGFVYDKNTLKLKQTFYYLSEGWGLTTDGKQLIMSNGTAMIVYIDPQTFRITRSILVHDQGRRIANINGLAYVEGKIYANIWPTNTIAMINTETGQVEGWIDIKALNPYPYTTNTDYAANGIAYNEQDKILLVTGKYWPLIFAIRLDPPF